jgi:hypothetical protein
MTARVPYPPPSCTGRWDCKACRKAGFVFDCKTCKRKRPWCVGVTDEHPGCCDVCWFKKHSGKNSSFR